jgi:hypothetical protein
MATYDTKYIKRGDSDLEVRTEINTALNKIAEELDNMSDDISQAGKVDDVKFNGTSVVSDKVAVIPRDLSQYDNSVSKFITNAVDDLTNYYTSKSIDGKLDDLSGKISAIPKFAISVVTALPTSNISTTTIYLLKSGSETDNLYTEYIYVNSAWEILGTQKLDLSSYAKKEDLTPITSDIETLKTNLGAVSKTIEFAITTNNGTAYSYTIPASTISGYSIVAIYKARNYSTTGTKVLDIVNSLDVVTNSDDSVTITSDVSIDYCRVICVIK